MPRNPQEEDEEYIYARISYVGFVDQLGLEGVVVLKSDEGKEFPIRAYFPARWQDIYRGFRKEIKEVSLRSTTWLKKSL